MNLLLICKPDTAPQLQHFLPRAHDSQSFRYAMLDIPAQSLESARQQVHTLATQWPYIIKNSATNRSMSC